MFLFRFLTPLTNKNEPPQTPAVIHSTAQKIILVVMFFITCRTPGKPAAGEEWKYGPAESKSTGSNFSRLLKKISDIKTTQKSLQHRHHRLR